MMLLEASFWLLVHLSGWADPKTCNETASCMNLLMHLVLQQDLQGQASCKLLDLGDALIQWHIVVAVYPLSATGHKITPIPAGSHKQ